MKSIDTKEEKFTLQENSDYWDDPNTRSLIDPNLKEIEIDFITKHLNSTMDVADFGCGAGDTAIAIVPLVNSVTGIERSDHLRNIAQKRIASNGLENITVEPGDILELDLGRSFDAIITERVLINLPSWDLQLKAIRNIHRHIKPGGLYLMIENTDDGANELNDLRTQVGLKSIPIHWHNLYLNFDTFIDQTDDIFELVERESFTLYYLLTRIYTQMFSNFEGFGINAVKDDLFEVSDKAARMLHEKIGGDIFLNRNNNVLGPIQGFVLRKR